MLEIRNLTKRFGKKTALEDFSFTFEPGVYGLLGPNGAGKTTLLRCISRIYSVKPNTILYNGTSIHNSNTYLNHLGYLPQKYGMFKELSVRDILLMLGDLKGLDKTSAAKKAEECLELVHLTERANSRVGSLSGGMVRRLGIAQALLNEPDILLLDEPTAGLDPEERLRFKNILAQIKCERIILLSTHIVEDVEAVCDKVAVMKSKNIAWCGTCQEIAELARQKLYCLPQGDFASLKGQYVIQKQFEQDGQLMVKVLSSEALPVQGMEPTVEDGYVCILKEI